MSNSAPSTLLPHRRRNPLTGEWVLCSPHRTARPWLGQTDAPVARVPKPHDPTCHLCAGVTRASGRTNPAYTGVYVFENDFRALLDESLTHPQPDDELFATQAATGTCRVICFSPEHDRTLSRMTVPAIEEVVRMWITQSAELGARYRWVQVFENKGAMMGCSNPHPHGQIWALDAVPTLPALEDTKQREYFERHGRPLLLDYAERELAEGTRVVCANVDWVVVVPFWATWPFETLLLPRFRAARLDEVPSAQARSLAAIVKELTVRYDNLFQSDCPYSMGWHGAPFAAEADHWQLHAHYYPPLLRSATVKKFMVGFEMLAEAQRDLTPETAAARLQACATIHFEEAANADRRGA